MLQVSWLLFLGAVSTNAYQLRDQTSLTNHVNLTACSTENLQYSCENTTAVQNTCCSVAQGGLFLQPSFWWTWTGFEDQGQLLPKESWTIHGLLNFDCNEMRGGEYCDFSRQYDPTPDPETLADGTVVPPYVGPSVDNILKDFGRYDLLDYLNTYWVNQGAPNWAFWAHEFSKYGTCSSTYDVACYGPNYQKHQEMIDFWEGVVRAWKMYPVYDMLAASGIVPSNKTTYTLSQIQNALKAQTGVTPYVACLDNGTVLWEVWHSHHLLASEQYGHFKVIDAITPTNCSSTGIHYYERTPTSERVVGSS